MKKVLLILFLLPLIVTVVFLSNRYSKNRVQFAPYPYEFTYKAAPISTEAPILIIGDRYGEQLSKFKDVMAKVMSTNLSEPIKIDTLALNNEGAHRTLQKIKAMTKLPLVIIYLGGSQESSESKFHQSQIDKHLKNFSYFENKLLASLLMIKPNLSKFVYQPVKPMMLDKVIVDTKRYTTQEIQKRSILNFKVFENEIDELFQYIKDRGAYLISLTSPINYQLEPINPCNPKLDAVTQKLLESIKEKTKVKDFKAAYENSKDLALMASTNSNAQFLHAKIALNLGKKKEAIKHFQSAKVYDCSLEAYSPVYNAIIKQKAKRFKVTLFDFQKMLEMNLGSEPIFINDTTVQTVYMQRLAKTLGIRIKSILKL